MADTSVAIRLGTTGAAEVKSDLTGIGDTGEAQAKRWSAAFEKAADDIAAAEDRRARAADKIAALLPATPMQQAVQANASTGYTGASARESAAAMRELLAEEDRLDAKARALTSTMEPLRQAQDRYNTSVADLTKLHDSGRISLELFLAEEQKAAAVLEKVSGSARDAATATKALDQARAGAGGEVRTRPETIVVGKSAAASASAFTELLPEQEKQKASIDALRARLDPLYGAQKRYDDELAHLATLKPGLTEEEYAKAVTQTERALEAAKRELAGHGGALSLNRAQVITAQSAVMRFTDSVIAGQSPLRAFALEAHKVGEVVSMDDGGVAGGMAKLTAILSPMNVAIAAGAATVIAGVAAWYSYDTAMNGLARTAQGTGAILGESAAQLEANAEAASAASKLTVGAAREIETSYVGVARSGDVLTNLTAITEDFAAATGQDLKSAQGDLVKIFGDAGVGAEELASKYGMLTHAQVEEIAKLQEAGDVEGAQKALLIDLQGVVQGAAEHLTGLALAWDNVKRGASEAGAALGGFMSRYGQTIVRSGEEAIGGSGGLTNWLFQQHGPTARARNTGQAKVNAFSGRADAIVRQYSGDNRPAITQTVSQLKEAIAGGTKDPAELRAWTEALAANEHALTSWRPAAEKANMVAAATAKVRQATTPAARAAAKAELDRVKAIGEVVTAENIQLRSMSRAEGYHDRATKSGAKHAETLAREAESMGVAARASLTLADAYLTGGSAAIEAEARKKAATDATKKGIDVEAQVRRQLDVTIGDQVVTSAKAAAQLGDETRARAAANDNMAAGKLAAAGLSQSLSDEAALRPLLTLRALAHGDALETLNRIVERYTANLRAAHAEEGRSNTLSATAGLDDAIAEAKADRSLAGDTSGARERAAALRAAQRQTRDWGSAGTPAGDAYEQRSVGKVDAELSTRHADAAASAGRAQTDQLAMTQAEIGLVGKSADEHDRVIARLQLQKQLAEQLGGDYAKYAPAILAQADATEQAKQKLQGLTQDWGEVRQAGEQLVDDVLSPSSWSDWGDMGKKVLADIEQELLKLAILNPLKNALFGGSGSTIGGVFGSLFGSKSTFTLDPAIANNGSSINTGVTLPHNAAGTADWSGGRTWMSENGGEVADLPSGTRIYPAAESRRMMEAANSNAGPARLELHLKSDLLTAQIADGADDRISIRAPGIAAGGAALGGQQAARARRRRLGTR